MKTPILLIIFKRYDTALQVFEQIRKARPERLYIAADAPRENIPNETAECNKAREIVNLIDWPCKVNTLFQEKNQGCGIGPIKAINWFFKNEEMGIILEDDCLPHSDFFPYCEELLYKYKDNDQIALITGRNHHSTEKVGNDSYYLSALHFCWGWASWRRVWNYYDYNLNNKTLLEYSYHLRFFFGNNWSIILWRLNIFLFCKKKNPKDIWDYQFVISTQYHHAYTIIPNVNLIQNIGFDERATHTSSHGKDMIKTTSIYPLHHPKKLLYNNKFDIKYAKTRITPHKNLLSFIKSFFTSLI